MRGLMSDEEWKCFAPFGIESGEGSDVKSYALVLGTDERQPASFVTKRGKGWLGRPYSYSDNRLKIGSGIARMIPMMTAQTHLV